MSDVSAHTIRLAAAEWHDRRERDGWTKDDETALETWLAQSPAHRVAFLRVDAAWKRADRLTALKSSGRIRRFANLAQIWPITIRMAAAAIVATAVGFAAAPYFKEKSTVQSYSTTIGGRETLALADGSQIELNTDTAVRVDITDDRRTVWLDKGEAFFQVRHDAERPFVVMVGERRITDIGTKFVIRRDDSRMKVAVLEGEVQLDALKGNSTPKLLKQGDVAVATGNTVAVSRKTQHTLTNELGWQRGVLVFDNVTLAEAAAEFNRYNREKIVIADPAAAQITIGATLPANDVPAFARVAKKIFGLHVERQGDTIVISH
jgi:transmembrane sensor